MSAALEHLRLMAGNNAYANEHLHEACCQLSSEEFAAPRTGFFPSLRETLNHIWEVDRYYLDALQEQGRGLSVFETPHLSTAEALREAQKEVDAQLCGFCAALCEADLAREVPHDRGEHGEFRESVASTLLHLFQHQIHHRGQAHAMLSGTGVEPPQLDEFFLKFDRHPSALKHL
ncbi:DinB family protein [Roseibium litorale]|uniref:DinB family protein n=1 Tax=Roseibium litorale TaxID=2803841 RepID=A0ABR9CQX0_9HYPH|nr:DinB family protein [Roseibium litorale]MBD8893224.1 DinB family protein [Roseibium litorale]